MQNNQLALIAVVAALALVGVVAVTIVTIILQQEAEGISVVGQCASFIGRQFQNSSAQLCHLVS
jgi:hypothetical protein